MSFDVVHLAWESQSSTPVVYSTTSSGEQARCEAYILWQRVESVLTNVREQRVAYLLFHCGLTPNEIVHRCAHEFVDVQEVFHLRSIIMKKLIHIV
ncbi:MAG: hypothetical protein NVS4B11_12320 [Ktedonobacteraceae bacterium]